MNQLPLNEHPEKFVLVNEFNEVSVKQFTIDLRRIVDSDQPIIPVYIDSFGGEAYSLLAMIDLVESCPKPVATVCLGKAMSCGAILLGCGDKGLRFIGKNSTVMIHSVSGFTWGKANEMKIYTEETERINALVYEILSEKCGHKNKNYFKNLIHTKDNIDLYLDANSAKKHKLVDHIGLPNFESVSTYTLQMPPKNRPLINAQEE